MYECERRSRMSLNTSNLGETTMEAMRRPSSLTSDLPTELVYTLAFNLAGIVLPTGEPLSWEEAQVLREALDRYISGLVNPRNPEYPAICIAYDHFVTWAASRSLKDLPEEDQRTDSEEWESPSELSEESEDNSDSDPLGHRAYVDLKRNRERRIGIAQMWDLNFASDEQRKFAPLSFGVGPE